MSLVGPTEVQRLYFCCPNVSVLVLLLSTHLVSSQWYICLLFWNVDELEVLHADLITCMLIWRGCEHVNRLKPPPPHPLWFIKLLLWFIIMSMFACFLFVFGCVHFITNSLVVISWERVVPLASCCCCFYFVPSRLCACVFLSHWGQGYAMDVNCICSWSLLFHLLFNILYTLGSNLHVWDIKDTKWQTFYSENGIRNHNETCYQKQVVKDVNEFLGLAYYYRRLTKGFFRKEGLKRPVRHCPASK